MRIAVTGATGFIGRHVLEALLAQGHDDLVVAGRRAPPADARIAFVETDLLADDPGAWIARHRPSHLLHLAWYAEHGRYWESPLNDDWRAATVALARAFGAHGGGRLVAAGSCAEYDWTTGDRCREGETPLRPSSRYGREKDRARAEVEALCAAGGVSFAWGRVFYPFGPGEARARLVPSVVDALLGRRAPFPIRLEHRRDPMPVADVAGAFAHLLQADARGAFNVCAGVPVRLGDLVERIGAALGRDPRALLALGEPDGAGPRFLVGDDTALLATGWRHRYDPADYLQAYVRALAREQPGARDATGGP